MKHLAQLLVLQAALVLAAAAPAQAQSISTLALEAAEARPADGAAAKQAELPPTAAPATVVVPVVAVTLYPGDTVTANMVTERPMSVADVERGAFARYKADIVGKAVRHILIADQPVPLNAVTEATVVAKGVATRVHLTEGGLTISGFAMPLESAGAGAIIRLKNIESGQVIVGVVEPNGSVRINMQ